MRYSDDLPDDLTAIVDMLTQYEPVDRENDIRKIDKAADDFLHKEEYPEADEVKTAISLL